MVVGCFNVFLGETKVTQQIKRRIIQLERRDTQCLCAELFAERPLVEHKADIKRSLQRAFDLVDFRLTKAVTDKRRGVDRRRLPD